MKKSLLALAVLASIAGVASAQSSVTIYGVVDAGLTRAFGGDGAITKMTTGVQSGNRLGFKGTEDLGGGLKANFQLENGFDLDAGTQRQKALFGRQAWVGLSGAFGAVNLGRQYNPVFVSLDTIDPFGTGLSGSSTNLMNPGTSTRVNNAVTYETKTFGGFSANAMYGAGESTESTKASSTIGGAVNYANGPLFVTVAYDRLNSDEVALTPSADQKNLLVGATYNFGPVTAHAAYEASKIDGGADYRDIMVGATVPFGPGSFLASYIDKNDRRANGNAGAKQFAVGYLYSLSKRTNLYTSYAKIRNDKGAQFTVSDASDGAGNTPNIGQNSSAFSVGIRHKF